MNRKKCTYYYEEPKPSTIPRFEEIKEIIFHHGSDFTNQQIQDLKSILDDTRPLGYKDERYRPV